MALRGKIPRRGRSFSCEKKPTLLIAMIRHNAIAEMLKPLVRRTSLFPYLLFRRALKETTKWEEAGRPSPPPLAVKARVLLAYAEVYDLGVFVETGTHYGTTVEAVRRSFRKVYTIELSPALWSRARKRFESDSRVKVIHGDSGKEIGRLMPQVEQPALFWLDAHYSGGVTARADKDTPILDELCFILEARDLRHVILIDDVHNFGVDRAYPTLEHLQKFILSKRPSLQVLVRNNIIRIVPN